ncbi:MAG: hypothetical protein EP346_00185 [Bacteroidetes bacterium]|nr:MAG: hypothetical protein EP346_00185 [Bacteroidota bacterium]
MLFNKTGESSDAIRELVKHISFIGKSFTFDRFESDLNHQESELKKLVGNAIYTIAHDHYQSSNYELDGDDTYAVQDELVHRMQSIIAILGYLDFAPSNDLTHDTDGRHVRVNTETKSAYDWQLDRHEDSLRNKAYRYIDGLIEFLDLNSDSGQSLAAWRTSTAYKKANELLVNSAEKVDRFFPIESSRRIFLLIASFIREMERKHIKPILGNDRYAELKAAIISADGLEEEDELFVEEVVAPPLVQLSMAQAFRRLPIRFWPEGIVQRYSSESKVANASSVATMEQCINVAQELEKIGKEGLKELADKMTVLDPPEEGDIDMSSIVKPATGNEPFSLT